MLYFYNIYIIPCIVFSSQFIGSSISFVLRSIEVILCLRKTLYKTHTFPRKNPMCEYYHNKLKFKKPYA